MLLFTCVILLVLYVYSYVSYQTYLFYLFFFFNDTATTEIYTLSLHDALPISSRRAASSGHTLPRAGPPPGLGVAREAPHPLDGHGIGSRCPYSASMDLPMRCVARKRWVLTVPTLTRQSAAISARERSS